MVVAFIDAHREFGIEPVCRVLSGHGVSITAGAYYARHSRPPAARTLRDEGLGEQIERIFTEPKLGRGLCETRKMWHLVNRDAEVVDRFGPVARCTVERPMRAKHLQGVRRGKAPITTTRPSDRTQ